MYNRYDIFDDLLGLKGEIEKFFTDNPQPGRRYDHPYVNVYESGDSIQVRALVPGVKPEDVKIGMRVKAVFAGERKARVQDIEHFTPVK